MGTYALSAGYYDAYYKRAQQVRTLVQREMGAALDGRDGLLMPCAPTVAYRLGEKTEDPLSMYKGDLMTVNLNLAGLPAISGELDPSCTRLLLSDDALGFPDTCNHARRRGPGKASLDWSCLQSPAVSPPRMVRRCLWAFRSSGRPLGRRKSSWRRTASRRRRPSPMLRICAAAVTEPAGDVGVPVAQEMRLAATVIA